MSSLQPTIGIYSKGSLANELLIKNLIEKDFIVLKNPKTILDIDYLIIDLSSGLNFENYSAFISSLKIKCLVVISENQKGLTDNILSLNKEVSVGVLAGDLSYVFDYTDAVLKELLSFGHSGSSFKLKGKKLEDVFEIRPVAKTPKVEEKIQEQDLKKEKKSLNKGLLLEILPTKQKINRKRGKIRFKFVKRISFKWVPFGKFFAFAAMSLFIFLLPFFSLIVSASTLYFGVKSVPKNISLSQKLFKTSRVFNNFTKSVNYKVSFYVNSAEVINESIDVAESGIRLIELLQTFTTAVVGNKIYDLDNLSAEMSAELDSLYSDVGFLKSNLDALKGFPIDQIKEKYNFTSIRLDDFSKKVYSAKNISSNLNTILGGDKPKKYLILFQNNMELRPTGGFIGSFAIATFDKGRLVDISVSDVYAADGQLNGHVEPPEPIRDILGEGGWYLRDANWDPDFASSSSKIEWFLDKELSTQVDGVISMDLAVAQNILKVIGPMTLPDFPSAITSDNLYAVTQSEVEDDFFPGSTKKASFLTSLSKQLINELENLDQEKKPGTLLQIYKSFEEKHIQVFLHDSSIQKIINSLGYGGSIDIDNNCGIRCFWDKYYLVDANLGVNKANLYITRSQDLYISIDKQSVYHDLYVTYTNSAGMDLGNKGRYKTYTRLIIPQTATISTVRLYQQGGDYKEINYKVEDINGRREIGFLLEVLPLNSSRLQIAWSLPQEAISQGGEYRLKINKQPGTDKDPLGVVIKKSELVPQAIIPKFILTREGIYSYNTVLGKDFEAKIFVK